MLVALVAASAGAVVMPFGCEATCAEPSECLPTSNCWAPCVTTCTQFRYSNVTECSLCIERVCTAPADVVSCLVRATTKTQCTCASVLSRCDMSADNFAVAGRCVVSVTAWVLLCLCVLVLAGVCGITLCCCCYCTPSPPPEFSFTGAGVVPLAAPPVVAPPSGFLPTGGHPREPFLVPNPMGGYSPP